MPTWGAQPVSSYSQDSAIIAEFTDEIKGHASPPPLLLANDLTWATPRAGCS